MNEMGRKKGNEEARAATVEAAVADAVEQVLFDRNRKATLERAGIDTESDSGSPQSSEVVEVYVYREGNRYLASALLPIDTPLRPGLNTLYASSEAVQLLRAVREQDYLNDTMRHRIDRLLAGVATPTDEAECALRRPRAEQGAAGAKEDERKAWEADMVSAGAQHLGGDCWEWDVPDFEFKLWQGAMRRQQRAGS